MRALLLVPAYNEAASLPGLLDELEAQGGGLEVLVVDDASADGSYELLARRGVARIELGQHLGLGSALRAGLRYARWRGFAAVVRLDADGQHDPADAGRLLEPLAGGRADAVVGSRHLGGGATGGGRGLLQRALAAALSMVSGRRVTDPTSGFWAFGPAALRLLADHYPSGYSEPELRLLLERNRLRVAEISVTMRRRLGGRSSLRGSRLLLALAKTVLAMIVVPRRRAIRRADAR